jgi:5-methylcytosine-specific restriction endonuclease McrA
MSQTYISAALRRLVRERSGDRCEYCLIPESATFAPHWIDHIIAEKHGGITEADNLANSCVLCNQCKGSDLSSIDPDTGEIVALFHPRRDRWTDHFRLVGGRIEPLSAVGRVTVRLLQFNNPERVAEREHLSAAGLL